MNTNFVCALELFLTIDCEMFSNLTFLYESPVYVHALDKTHRMDQLQHCSLGHYREADFDN